MRQEDDNGDIRRLYYSGQDLIAEYDETGAMLNRYVHGLSAGDDPLVSYDGSSASIYNSRFLFRDPLGSIIHTTDRAGGNDTVNAYDEYGAPDTDNTGRFQYTGQTVIPELGLYYYKARMYSPMLGRFLQTDPIGYGDGMNMYAYVGNDPVNGVDPSGLYKCFGGSVGGQQAGWTCKPGWTAIGGIAVPDEVVLPNSQGRTDENSRSVTELVNGEPQNVNDQIRKDICGVGQAVETIGGVGSDAGVAATVAGLVYPPVAGGAAVFTELSGITEAGGQLVQDLTQGDVRAGLARAAYGIFGGKVASAVARNYGRVSSFLSDSELNARDTVVEAYVNGILDNLPGVNGVFNPEDQC